MPITAVSDVLGVGKPWPPTCDETRAKSYKQGRVLLSKNHSEVFDDIVALMRRDKRTGKSFVQLGLPRRIVKAYNAMVLGEAPTFTAKEEGEADAGEKSPAQEQVEAYVEEFDLIHESHQSMTDIQALGDGLLQVTLEDKGAAGLYPDINAVDPCIWYPVVSPRDKQHITAHILAWTWEDKCEGHTVNRIRAEVHERGMITTYLGEVDGAKIKTFAEAEEYDLTTGARVVNPVMTGVDELLIVPMFNFRSTSDSTGVSDFADLAPILEEIEVRLYLIAAILDKHADPKLAGPRIAAEVNPVTGKEEIRMTDYFVLEEGQLPPTYITWDGQLTAAWHEIDFLWEQALFVMETSKALFGLIDGQVASGAAMKRLLIASIMKAGTLRSRLNIGLKKALKLASLLHNSVDPSAPIFAEVGIQWSDGLPADDIEVATYHATLVAAGIESRKDAIRAVFKVGGAELVERMDNIAEERAASAPAIGAAPRIALTPAPDAGGA